MLPALLAQQTPLRPTVVGSGGVLLSVMMLATWCHSQPCALGLAAAAAAAAAAVKPPVPVRAAQAAALAVV